MKKLNKKQKLIILIAIVTIIVIIGMVVGANAIRTNIINSSYESSNSGSNNGNLLPEYIKRGITLGGVTGTLEDLDTSDATATEWDIAYGKTAYVKGEKITGLFVPRSNLKVGDYVEYTPDTASDYSIASNVSGGYNNCVYVLNDLCASQYSNSNLGVTARSINLEDDIEPKMNEAGKSTRDSYRRGQTGAYGNVRTYTSSSFRYYPTLYAQENGSGIDTGVAREDGIAKNDSYYDSPTGETYTSARTSLTVTSDYYEFSETNCPSYFDDTTWYNLVFKSGTCYLASRCVGENSYYADFSLRTISEQRLVLYISVQLEQLWRESTQLFPSRSFSWVLDPNIWRRRKCRTSISAFSISV